MNNINPSTNERKRRIEEIEHCLLRHPYDNVKYSRKIARAAAKLVAVLSCMDTSNLPDMIDDSCEDETTLSEEDRSSSTSSTLSDMWLDESLLSDDEAMTETSSISSVEELITDDETIEIELNPIKADTAVSFLTRYRSGDRWAMGHVERYSSALRQYEINERDNNILVSPKNVRAIARASPPFQKDLRVLAIYPNTNVYSYARTINREGDNWLLEFEDQDENMPRYREVIAQFVMILDEAAAN